MKSYNVTRGNDTITVQAETPEEAVKIVESGTALDPIAKGLTMALSDEVAGLLGAIPGALQTGQTIPEAYAGIRDVARRRQAGFEARNPIAAPMLEIGGALPTGIVGGARMAGTQPTMKRMAGVGATEAGIAGFGQAEGDIFSQALQSAMAMPLGIAGGLAGGWAGRQFDRATGSQNIPQRIIRKGLEADMLPLSTTGRQMAAQRAAQMGPQATPVDVGGEGMVFLGQQVAGASPATRAMAEKALVSGRRAGQTQRIFNAVEDATGLRPDYGLAGDEIAETVAMRTEQARPLWDAVNAMPMPMTETLENALDQGIVKRAFKLAQEEAALTGRQLPNIYEMNEAGDLVKTGIAPDTEAWTMIKSHIDGVLRESSKYTDPVTGRPTKLGRAMQKFRDDLVGELKDQNKAYGPALDQWAGDTAIIDAVDAGKNILSSSQWVDDVRRMAKNMSQSEKEGYLAGAVNAIREKMGRVTGEGQTGEFSFMQSPNFQAKLRAFLPEGQQGDQALTRLIDSLKTERRFKEVGTKVMQGSQTAFREEATRMLNPMARDASFIENVASGNLGAAATSAIRKKVEDIAGGVPPETKERIAELIFQPGGTEALYNYLQQSQIDQGRINRLMALTRQIPTSIGAGTTTAGYNPGTSIARGLAELQLGY